MVRFIRKDELPPELERDALQQTLSGNFRPELNDQYASLLGKNFFKICEDMGFSQREQAILLGEAQERTIRNLQKKNSIPKKWDAFRRVSLLLGIVKNLSIMYPRNPEVQNNWMRTKRNIFKGKSALEMIIEDPMNSQAALFTVRRVLDLYRNGILHDLT